MQSTHECRDETDRLHVAIIMDGNGRWATARGLPRTAGHHAGIRAVRRVVEAASALDVAILTLFAFSADNWRRPAPEVGALMGLLRHYLHRETDRLADSGTRLTVIGRRDRLPDGFGAAIATAERATMRGRRLHLRVALDYSARDSILRAASRCDRGRAPSREEFSWLLSQEPGAPVPDVDLLIRTGGEKRMSDFLLWECAYAELLFSDRMWPDFSADDLSAAITDFRRRERRFGAIADAQPTCPTAA